MLTLARRSRILLALKSYKKQFLNRDLTELDESGTRLMINSFLCDVLGYLPIEEIKTEYMIKGTYADYVIQIGGVRHFLVEVKAFDLTDASTLKHDAEHLQYLHQEAIAKKSLKQLWNKREALDPLNVASIIYCKEIMGVLKKLIKNKYRGKCEEADIMKSLNRIVLEKIDPTLIKPHRSGKVEKKGKKVEVVAETLVDVPGIVRENGEAVLE